MTNEEWLKSQDKETITDILHHSCKCCFYNYSGYYNSCSADVNESCTDGIAKWLSMEHSEGDELEG